MTLKTIQHILQTKPPNPVGLTHRCILKTQMEFLVQLLSPYYSNTSFPKVMDNK